MDALMRWNRRTTNTTYADFKTFLQEEYHALGKVGGLTVENSGLNSANAVTELKQHQERLTAQLKEELQDNVQSSLKAFAMATINENTPPAYPYHTPTPPVYDNSLIFHPTYDQQQMFATQQQNMLRNIMQPFQEMTNRMNQLQNQIQNLQLTNQTPPSTFCPPITPQKTPSTINPRTGLEWKRYCWSCGCCPHWGKNCPFKKKGHKSEATFSNRMGGSNKNCR